MCSLKNGSDQEGQLHRCSILYLVLPYYAPCTIHLPLCYFCTSLVCKSGSRSVHKAERFYFKKKKKKLFHHLRSSGSDCESSITTLDKDIESSSCPQFTQVLVFRFSSPLTVSVRGGTEREAGENGLLIAESCIQPT